MIINGKQPALEIINAFLSVPISNAPTDFSGNAFWQSFTLNPKKKCLNMA